MALPSEKVSELKQIIHNQLSQVEHACSVMFLFFLNSFLFKLIVKVKLIVWNLITPCKIKFIISSHLFLSCLLFKFVSVDLILAYILNISKKILYRKSKETKIALAWVLLILVQLHRGAYEVHMTTMLKLFNSNILEARHFVNIQVYKIMND